MSDSNRPLDPDRSTSGQGTLDGTVLYGDFNCPFSALAHHRALRLNLGNSSPLDWRAVEHDSAIPAQGPAVDQMGRTQFEAELELIASQAVEDDPPGSRVPARRLNTSKLNVLLASLPASQRNDFARTVFDAYWRQDIDLNDPREVAGLGVTPTADGEDLARQWQQEWEALERRIVPMLRLPDGTLSRGLGALGRLQ